MNALSEIAVNHGLAREDSPSSRRQKLFDTEGGTAKGPGGAPQNMDSRLQSKAIPTYPFYQLASPSAFSISSVASVQPVQEDVLPFTSTHTTTTTTTSTSASTHFPVTPYNSNFLGDSMLSFYSLASGNDATPFQSAITLVEDSSRRRSWAESFLSLFHMNEKLPVEPEAIANPYNGFWRSTSTIAIDNTLEEAALEEAGDEDDDDYDLSVYDDDFLLYSDVDDFTTITSISALPALGFRTRPWVDSYLSLLQPCEPRVIPNHSENTTTQQPSGPEFRYPVPVWLGQYIAVARIAQPDVAIDELIELYEASKFMLDENGDPLKMLPAEALPEPSCKRRGWRRALKKAAIKVCAKFKQKTMHANGCTADRVSSTNGPLEQEQEQEEEVEQKPAKLRRRTNLACKVVSLFKSKVKRSINA
ncbi:hypothetical protein BCR37DRAFT_376519 [Protomyces lactucae-debilis]|uniref:Uncharacterized protein n=1 Tax=Protomyces lactucae-debilis TaxID=2754530 RepID=A0A1Y2FWS3_PROLT|nr:uncharacterized protein BCR37DRAFT_376519 [Protomyces lactucae-debilis]ORY87125.1 hypothetical protein BCR37DRAFT_376519 [Protomyces lactucae-debilis]